MCFMNENNFVFIHKTHLQEKDISNAGEKKLKYLPNRHSECSYSFPTYNFDLTGYFI